MLYVKQYNKQALDRSSLSTVDYYKRLITVLNNDTFDLNTDISLLLDTVNGLQERLKQDKQEIQNDLNTAKDDLQRGHVKADETIRKIQEILDGAENELDQLEEDASADCDYCYYTPDCQEGDCAEGICDYCDYCDYSSTEPGCDYTEPCSQSCTYNTCTFSQDDCRYHIDYCSYYEDGEEGCSYEAHGCNYYDDCNNCEFTSDGGCTYTTSGGPGSSCDVSGTCNWTNEGCEGSYGGICTFVNDGYYDPNCENYTEYPCSHSGACTYNGPCTYDSGDGKCSYSCNYDAASGNDKPCSYTGTCTYNSYGADCSYSGACIYSQGGGYCDYTGSCSAGYSGACSFENTCNYDEDCHEMVSCQWDSSCGEIEDCTFDDCAETCAYSEDCHNDLTCQEDVPQDCYEDCWDDTGCYDCQND